MTTMSRPLAGKRVLFVGIVDWAVLLHWRDLLKRLVVEGADVTVMCASSGDLDKIRQLGVDVVDVPFTRAGQSPVVELRTILRIARGLRQLQPDVIHTVTIKPNLYVTLCARLTSRKSFMLNAVTGFGYVFESEKSRLLRVAVSLAYRLLFRSSRVHVQVENPDAVDRIVRLGFVPRARAHLIEGAGVDCEEFSPGPVPKAGLSLDVLMPARILYDKGVVEFLEAARRVRAAGVDGRFRIAGRLDEAGNPAAIPERDFLQMLVTSDVEWLGDRRDVADLMRETDVVALPSYHEGLPKALLEGAASGCALVATDIPGCRPVVLDGVNGRLVEPRSARALADALIDLGRRPGTVQEMGIQSRRLALERFEINKILDKFVALYCQVQGVPPPVALRDDVVVVGAGWLGCAIGSYLGCQVLPQRNLRREEISQFDAVIIASGRNRVRRSETLSAVIDEESEVLATTLEWCRELRARVVLLGSADVCGMQEVIRGSTPPSPMSRYGQLKLGREQVALTARDRGTDVVVLRLAAVHGRGKPQTKRLVRLGGSRVLVLPGRLSRSVSLISLRTLTDAITSIVSVREIPPVVAVGSGYVRADELFQALARQQGRRLRLVGLPLPAFIARLGAKSTIPLLAWTARFASSRVVEMEAGVPPPTIDELTHSLVGQ
jgi:glycosyltransferase involved in cell wall biosynthesis/nucleoside-diphosphate-sugar epimerase